MRYLALQSSATAEYREKGSKFLAQTHVITSPSDIKFIQTELKKQHPKAVHVCFAFAIGFEQEHQRANDDGEPSGSAGLPILNAIKSSGISDVLVTVTRYYGGTNLGVSGLIQAYNSVSIEALTLSETYIQVIYCKWKISCVITDSYIAMAEVQKLGYSILDSEFTDTDCTLICNIPVSEVQDFQVAFEPFYTIELSEFA